MAEAYDVVIIGAGPAGLNAALLLGRSQRTVLLCDTGRPRNAASNAIHGFLSRDGIAPQEFLRLSRAELEQYSTVRLVSGEAVSVNAEDGGFVVSFADASAVHARKLLMA